MAIVRRTLKQIMNSGGGGAIKRLRAHRERSARLRRIPKRPGDRRLSNFRKVYNPPLPDVKAIRKKLKLSQAEFASRFGFSVRTVQQWEQGARFPTGPPGSCSRNQQSPQAVERALYG